MHCQGNNMATFTVYKMVDGSKYYVVESQQGLVFEKMIRHCVPDNAKLCTLPEAIAITQKLENTRYEESL